MPQPPRCVSPNSIIVGYDFSTGGVKALAFDLSGNTVAEIKLTTDLWTDFVPLSEEERTRYNLPAEVKLYKDSGNRELNLMMLEGQAHAATRELAAGVNRRWVANWLAAGISATHHSAGRIDKHGNQVRRAICWNDQTLHDYHTAGLERLGGQDAVRDHIGGPWAERYSLSHLVKDEATLGATGWAHTELILPHGPLAGGYLTGVFDVTSVSSAASTGMMDLQSDRWCKAMLNALENELHRELAWKCLPNIVGMNEPIGAISEAVALGAGLPAGCRPLVFPTLDDQAAGLLGGGAVDAGQLAIILGNSAVVNSSSDKLPPRTSQLDAMKLNWGPFLWMRCYSNGAQFVDVIAGKDWYKHEAEAAKVPAGCGGTSVLPFLLSEPSVGINKPQVKWCPKEPGEQPKRVRACLEAITYLIARAVKEHEAAGQEISQITVSGGMARSKLMCEILASVLNKPLKRLVSNEGPALGAAVVALAGMENYLRKQHGIAEPFKAGDAVASMVKFHPHAVQPNGEWVATYQDGLKVFEKWLGGHPPC